MHKTMDQLIAECRRNGRIATPNESGMSVEIRDMTAQELRDALKHEAYWPDRNDPLAMVHGKDKLDKANGVIVAYQFLEWKQQEDPSNVLSELIKSNLDPDKSWLDDALNTINDLRASFSNGVQEIGKRAPYDFGPGGEVVSYTLATHNKWRLRNGFASLDIEAAPHDIMALTRNMIG